MDCGKYRGLEYLEVFEYLGVGVGPFTGVGVV